MGIRKHIPNALTCCNLLCGCLAVICSSNPVAPLIPVFLAAFFDFFDGLAARSLKAYSPIGKDLDSLADMVSFGVAPASVGYRYILGLGVKAFGYDQPLSVYFFRNWWPAEYLANQPAMKIQTEGAFLPLDGGNITLFLIALMLPLFIAVFSALRLAKFNNDTRQKDNFIGLATPACAIFYISLLFYLYELLIAKNLHWNNGNVDLRIDPDGILSNPALSWVYWLPAFIVPVLCWLLVSEIPMFSMKFRNLSWQDNKVRYIFLIIAVVEVVMTIMGGFPFAGCLCAIILTYIILNFLMLAFRRKPSHA
ncbi:MAG: CDP-alcohol phosphatidyltransferase family protein [Spirochaetia bacterium]|nr:CDP-alcohol phosphatidyltransferase family protein [Spirochaetia bacterium]